MESYVNTMFLYEAKLALYITPGPAYNEQFDS